MCAPSPSPKSLIWVGSQAAETPESPSHQLMKPWGPAAAQGHEQAASKKARGVGLCGLGTAAIFPRCSY